MTEVPTKGEAAILSHFFQKARKQREKARGHEQRNGGSGEVIIEHANFCGLTPNVLCKICRALDERLKTIDGKLPK